MKAAFTLIPAESRRLIAKAVVRMEPLRQALKKAYVIINGGTTNGFIVQELLKRKDLQPQKFTAGTNTHRLLCVTDNSKGYPFPIVLHKGKKCDKTPLEALRDFHLETVIVKGASAIDPLGNVGIITAGFDSGSIAATYGIASSQGLKYIIPVGLEKMVASVQESLDWTGAKTLDYTMGADFGLFFVPRERGYVVNEIEALKILANVEAKHIASGGVGESAGSVVLIIRGPAANVKKAIALIESIKGEPTVPGYKGICETCGYACTFKGKKIEDLPKWLRD